MLTSILAVLKKELKDIIYIEPILFVLLLKLHII